MEKGKQRINGKTRAERFADLYKELLYIAKSTGGIIASDIRDTAKKVRVSAVTIEDAELIYDMAPDQWVSYIMEKRMKQEEEAKARYNEKKRKEQEEKEEAYAGTLFTPEPEPEQEPEQEEEPLPTRPRGITSTISVAEALRNADYAVDFVRKRKQLSDIFGADYVRENPLLIVGAAIVEELTALRIEIAQLQTILDNEEAH